MGISIGELVITWGSAEPLIYGGPNDHPGMESTAYDLRNGNTPTIKCDPQRVAPAGITLPTADPRVKAVKHPRKPQPWYAGPWELQLPGVENSSWFKTKRDAMAAGLRRIAILDWHGAAKAEAEAMAEEVRIVKDRMR